MSLSNKRYDLTAMRQGKIIYLEEDVKEFIEKIKDALKGIDKLSNKNINKIIDEEAGEALTAVKGPQVGKLA